MKVLITGASRGIGRALVEKALAENYKVIAVSRSQMNLSHPNLTTVQADISTPKGLSELIKLNELKDGLDILINNAGVLHDNDEDDDHGKTFAESFHLNATTPFLLTKKLMPLLKKSKDPKVIQISTLMGSLQDNSSGGYYSYRSSKIALNMITKSLSIDHPELTFSLIHPGWVKTEMGGPQAPVEVRDSAQGIWKVISNLKSGQELMFQDYTGKKLPW